MSEPIQECSIAEATWLRKWVIVNPYNISERMEFDSVHDLAQHLFNSKELILNMVKEREALLAATQWRPIETAPKDEEILVWNKEMKSRAWTVIWSDEYGAFVSSQTHFLFKGDFTHWMPLPKPPSV